MDKVIPSVAIVSWMGGEHWYIGNVRFLHLEDAIAFCNRNQFTYEIVEASLHLYKNDGD